MRIFRLLERKESVLAFGVESSTCRYRLSSAKYLVMAAFIHAETQAKDPLKLLDIGCGNAKLILYARSPHIEFTGFDVSDVNLEIARRAGYQHIQQGDIREGLPFLDESFDIDVQTRWIYRAPIKKKMELIYNTARYGLLRLILAIFIYVGFYAQHTALAAEEPTSSNNNSSIIETVSGDYRSFYSKDRLIRMGIVLGVAGIAANTNIDMNIRNWYQDKVRNAQTDSWSSDPATSLSFNAKFFGEGKYMVPVALLAASVNYINTDTAIGNWGANASRAYIVGFPAMWAMQGALGATRPGDRPEGSSWGVPFSAANGVSGHAFVGAVPFLTIASMNPDNNYVKYPAYVASAAAAWSRINDDKHFTSQVALGWYMAWEAVDAVFENNQKKKGVTVAPMAGLDGFGLMAKGSW